MKQISEMDGKMFTSSLNICQEPAVERGGGGRIFSNTTITGDFRCREVKTGFCRKI